MFKVLRNGLLRYILYTCPKRFVVVVVVVVVVLGCVNVVCSCTHVIDATEWTASVDTSHMSKHNVTRVQSATEWTGYILHTCPNLM